VRLGAVYVRRVEHGALWGEVMIHLVRIVSCSDYDTTLAMCRDVNDAPALCKAIEQQDAKDGWNYALDRPSAEASLARQASPFRCSTLKP